MTEAKLRLPPTQHFYDAAMRRSAEIDQQVRGTEARSVSLDEARDMALRHLHEMERRRAESAAEAWTTDEEESLRKIEFGRVEITDQERLDEIESMRRHIERYAARIKYLEAEIQPGSGNDSSGETSYHTTESPTIATQ